MNNKGDKGKRKRAEDLQRLIDRDPPEEEVHQIFKDRLFGTGRGNPRFGERFICGTISKFPITPDRIPDFTTVLLNVRASQTPSRVTFIELKKPTSSLYTTHARMSKELNDAWMECVETSRLMADNFRDCLRRVVKTLDEKRLAEYNAVYSARTENEKCDAVPDYGYDQLVPSCNSVIVIGRRSSLDREALLRTRELSASTGSAIRVITYDAVLDWVAEAGEDDFASYLGGWYW